MKKTQSNTSIWAATAEMLAFDPLREDLTVDVCVVGAGIAGLSTAYLLAREGKSVAVLEDGELAGGMTRMTTAHLSNAIDDRLSALERWHGGEGARLAQESHMAAIEKIGEIARAEGIDCDYERLDGFLFLPPGREESELDEEFEASKRAGIAVEKLARTPIDSFDFGPCLRYPELAQVHPLKYLAGVARAIARDGGKIFTRTHADKIEDGEPATVTAGVYTVTCGAVVVATNTPINDRVAIHTKQKAYMTYVVGARVARGSVPRGLYWDTADPYHYVRLQPLDDGNDLLIVGGEDHKTGQADDADERHGRLEEWARKRFAMMGPVEYRWGGQVMETLDGLGYLGRNPGDKHIYIVTGDSGMGITHGTIGAMLITDLIAGRENPWEKVYDPSRKTLRAAGKYLKDTANMAAQYADWVTPGDVESEEAIAADSGALIRRGLKKVAVYRDEAGVLHEMSAVCPHLGCIVQWNDAEKTWDCPCHGSRFMKTGEVINGPANRGLAEIEAGAAKS